MNVKAAFAIWDAASKLMKECGRKKKCIKCQNIDAVLHEILVGEPLIDYFGYRENAQLGLISLNDRKYKNTKTWAKEVDKRLAMIRRDKAGEELPEELADIFERMREKMNAHPPVED
ncbi:MAG TPA: hypothetical protein P5096_02475 [Patescibacteria group bacterium]|nr:hypothetical protein [Patescibacteria group bacterium]